MHLDYTKVIILILWWRNFQLEYWRNFQLVSTYMKEIAAVCGIDKVLTTHCARHTFACMAVEYGMPIDVLAKILGHSNTNMTRHYAKFSETVIGRAMEAFGERLASAASAE